MTFRRVFPSLIIALALFGIASGASAQQAVPNNVINVTPSNLAAVLNPPATASYKLVYVLACNSSMPDCQKRLGEFSLTAFKAQGGWLSPTASATQFYFLDTTAGNLQVIDDLCHQYWHVALNHGKQFAGWSVCDSKTYYEPIGFLFQVDGRSWRREFPGNEDFTATLSKFTSPAQ